jgi:hypothetical protein
MRSKGLPIMQTGMVPPRSPAMALTQSPSRTPMALAVPEQGSSETADLAVPEQSQPGDVAVVPPPPNEVASAASGDAGIGSVPSTPTASRPPRSVPASPASPGHSRAQLGLEMRLESLSAELAAERGASVRTDNHIRLFVSLIDVIALEFASRRACQAA